MECHYYHPYKDPRTFGIAKPGMVNFERELHYAGFQIHYLSDVGMAGNKPNTDMISDATLFASYRKVDGIVLLTTQGQFSPLPEKLRDMGCDYLQGFYFSKALPADQLVSYVYNNRRLRIMEEMRL